MSKIFRNGLFLIVLTAFGLSINGCDLDIEKKQPETDVFPLHVGNYWMYRVAETQIEPYNVETDFEYELKAVVTDSFPNALGGYSYLINRFKRVLATDPWQSLDTWTARVDSKEVVITEGSVPYVRITFPLKVDRAWNGNAYNNIATGEFCSVAGGVEECDKYTLSQSGETYTTTTGLSFDETIEVVQNNDPDRITKYDIRTEVYARKVGLIYKSSVIYTYCVEETCSGLQLIEDGIRYTQELIEYGLH